MRPHLASFLPLVAMAGTACAVEPSTSSTSMPVVYGDDDRQDVYAFADATWAARAAEVSAVMVSTSSIDASNPSDVHLPSTTLEDSYGVCSDERFATQPTAGACSATLIAPDLVLTAGHCVSSGSCGGTSFVFDYWMTDASTLHTITTDDVYGCAQVMARTESGTVDFAVVRLDRNVVGRTPATVDVSGAAIANTAPLIVQGYPSGLPLKIDDGGAVRDGRPGTLDYFVANLDTFGGNSGSGVYTANGTLVGVLVRGDTDYVLGRCNRVNRCTDDGCSGESSTYAFRAIASLCDTAPQPGLCACGDGTCDTAGGETSAHCPLDCGDSCGDGVCNPAETPGETEATCCDDCGCSTAGDACYQHACMPDPTVGDACGSAIELTPTGIQVIDDSTDFAVDDFAGSCVGGGSGDRVYTFTLSVPTVVDASVNGYDTGLYLESTCGDTATEIACNDDVDPGNDTRSALTADLEPGTYALIVDGYDGAVGAYQLTVVFSPSCADADLDGTCDANDGCPDDPDKVDPGGCGCGVAEGTCDDPEDDMGGGCSSAGGGDPVAGALLLLGLVLACRVRSGQPHRRGFLTIGEGCRVTQAVSLHAQIWSRVVRMRARASSDARRPQPTAETASAAILIGGHLAGWTGRRPMDVRGRKAAHRGERRRRCGTATGVNLLEECFAANRRWADETAARDPEFFKRLENLQAPELLWIGCSDSRLPPNEIIGRAPGELFVHRNVANLVEHTDVNCLSVLQYAVDVLGVKHVIVCGHYGCGGVRAAMSTQQLGLIDNWLRHIRDVHLWNREELAQIKEPEARVDRLAELNVEAQVANVCHTTIVQDAWRRGQPLTVHGWIYSLRDGLLRDLGLTIESPSQIPPEYRLSD